MRRREIGRFASVAEAIATSEGLVDSFLLKHYHPKLSGKQLYELYVQYGPDLYVDACVGQPVFHGWEYARTRVCQICGRW